MRIFHSKQNKPESGFTASFCSVTTCLDVFDETFVKIGLAFVFSMLPFSIIMFCVLFLILNCHMSFLNNVM